MLINFFNTDESYKEQVAEYQKKDTMMAIVVWGIVMVTYYFMGQLYANKGVYLGIQVNMVLAILCIWFILLRKQKITTIGFTKGNAVKSIILGSVLGVLIVIGNNVINIVEGSQLAPLQSIAKNFIYYMLVISLVEELIFRGYIQTRIYGLVKKPILAIILGGILFMLIHIPFKMGQAKMGLFTYLQLNWITLIFTFIWHVIFDFLYRKYNTIYAPAIFHGLMDWANYLFL
ncbi:MAG: hypothetical protein CVU87_00245 [Firmicutes bacterium HGW-Firmicutes-12]|nr:MAG: hypothetical protein CVU87_00245 [Firmicutes bacterium HGW-Firmicutes-12]